MVRGWSGFHPGRYVSRRCRRSRRGTDFNTNYFARNHQFNATVKFSSSGGVVRRHRKIHTIADCGHGSRWNSILGKIVANRARALFREFLIELNRASDIGVTFHLQVQARMRNDDTRDSRQRFARIFFQSVFACIEEDILHIDD